ncbi:MAG: hypothetical protein Q8P18_25485 [Pseudomonadota bacterium]|nr:hypothetical protein [Pseudomonadota bacterium]
MLASSIAVIVLSLASLAVAVATLIWTWHIGQFDLDVDPQLDTDEAQGGALPFGKPERPASRP